MEKKSDLLVILLITEWSISLSVFSQSEFDELVVMHAGHFLLYLCMFIYVKVIYPRLEIMKYPPRNGIDEEKWTSFNMEPKIQKNKDGRNTIILKRVH